MMISSEHILLQPVKNFDVNFCADVSKDLTYPSNNGAQR